MPKIHHVAAIDVLNNPPPEHIVVISIRDPGTRFASLYDEIDRKLVNHTVIPIYAFDLIDEIAGCLTETDAAKIAKVLIEQSELGNDVVVHCTAGICRSGAVAEAGMMLGLFEKQRSNRQPNILFKRKIVVEVLHLKPEQVDIAISKRGI